MSLKRIPPGKGPDSPETQQSETTGRGAPAAGDSGAPGQAGTELWPIGQDRLHWQPGRPPPHPEPGGLHLWRIQVDDSGGGLEACLPLLGTQQHQRAQRLLRPADRGRYIRAQAGLRRILGQYLGIHPRAVRFAYGPAGKPTLDGSAAGLAFNLTTTGDLALVAVSWGGEIGVDCERIRPRRDLDATARRMFTPEQVRILSETPEPRRLEAFYRAWTALEADVKADGRGLFRPRAGPAIPPQVMHCIPAPGHIAAVARAALPPLDTWVALELEPLPSERLPD